VERQVRDLVAQHLARIAGIAPARSALHHDSM
jgi:hypothetical protein